MVRYGKILLLASLTGLILTDIEAVSRFLAGKGFPRGAAIAADAGGSSTPGITVTRPVPSVMESLGDVQARAPLLEKPLPRDRHIRFRRIPRTADTTTFSPQLSLTISPAPAVSDAPTSGAPALDDQFPKGFAGLGNPDPLTEGDLIPPDTMGAAGPNHLVTLLNSHFGVFVKATGALVSNSKVSLPSFWESLDPATDNASTFVYDPKILYDTISERFIAVTLSADDGPPSWIFIAVSPPSDPTGAWVKVAIDADQDADNVVRNNWADYPGLGVDANNIYITANMFDNTALQRFQYSKVWVVPIDQLLAGPPPDNLTWTEIRDPVPQGPVRDSIQPAHTFEGAIQYFIREADSGALGLASVTGGTTWNDLGTIPVASFASATFLPPAPQFGNPNGIDTSDTRMLNAVFRNGFVWATHHVLGPNGKVEVAWYRINPGPPVSLVEQGRINDPTRWYYYPSIGVNQNGDVAIGFTGSSSAEYASAYYTARSSSGPAAGVMQPPSLLKSGVASYYKAGITFGGTNTDNRWGDFSATVVDPSDNLTFWTLQEYAAAPTDVHGTQRSMWGTWWGKFRAPAIAAPDNLIASAVSTTQVDLTWKAAGGQTGFRVERRQLPGGDFDTISPNLGSGVTAYTDNTGVAGTTYSYRVRALAPDPGPDSFSNEATAVTMSPPPISSGGGGGGGCSIPHGANRADDLSPLTTVLILLSPIGITGMRRYLMRDSHRFRP